MIEKLVANYLQDERDRLNKAVQYGKEQVQKGELAKDEYQRYLRLTFQNYLEFILGMKIDIAIPE